MVSSSPWLIGRTVLIDIIQVPSPLLVQLGLSEWLMNPPKGVLM